MTDGERERKRERDKLEIYDWLCTLGQQKKKPSSTRGVS